MAKEKFDPNKPLSKDFSLKNLGGYGCLDCVYATLLEERDMLMKMPVTEENADWRLRRIFVLDYYAERVKELVINQLRDNINEQVEEMLGF